MMVKKFEQLVRKKGMTQQELSEKMNVSSAAISNRETGRHYPDIDMLVELSHILNFSLDKLFKEDTQMVQDLATEQKEGRKRMVVIGLLIAGMLALVVVSFSMVYSEVGAVHDFFTPR